MAAALFCALPSRGFSRAARGAAAEEDGNVLLSRIATIASGDRVELDGAEPPAVGVATSA